MPLKRNTTTLRRRITVSPSWVTRHSSWPMRCWISTTRYQIESMNKPFGKRTRKWRPSKNILKRHYCKWLNRILFINLTLCISFSWLKPSSRNKWRRVRWIRCICGRHGPRRRTSRCQQCQLGQSTLTCTRSWPTWRRTNGCQSFCLRPWLCNHPGGALRLLAHEDSHRGI